jgi:tRNA wybutosine-synthesizing protein 4
MRKLVLQFLDVTDPSYVDGTPRKQVLSLGAGFDTLFFQLKDEGRAPHLFVELDFVEVTTRKAGIIASHGELLAKLGSDCELHKGKSPFFDRCDLFRVF